MYCIINYDKQIHCDWVGIIDVIAKQVFFGDRGVIENSTKCKSKDKNVLISYLSC